MSLIELKDVGYSYNGEQKAVDGISFSIEKGSYTTIIGHNGSGKATLAKL
ncbi:MAG: ATP-binding cassette domain-containing protein, partial [Erysipelotrichaceae bacterium]|nr:ATP-binding cassette domain-containing protein [Erysipelotrichaceae bacterium]